MNYPVPVTHMIMPARFYGAAVSGDEMMIVAIERRDDSFVVATEACSTFSLRDESQYSLRVFKKSVEKYLALETISEITLRLGRQNQNQEGARKALRMAAALEMIGGLKVGTVQSTHLRIWENLGHMKISLPETSSSLQKVSLRWQAALAARLSYSVQFENHKLVHGRIIY